MPPINTMLSTYPLGHPKGQNINLDYITLYYIIYWDGFTLVFCNLYCIYYITLQPPPPPPPQCKLQYVHAIYAQVLLGKRPPAQVAEGIHQRKLERMQQQHKLHMGTATKHIRCPCTT